MRSKIEEKLLNIGIFAHVDAGKTTVTENLLFQAGVIKDIGRVDSGNTKTDQMDLEKKRGISIQSTPISFDYKGFKVNLVDTPGHVDFIAEVERSMGILDGAVLVISAKEGVQSHTILLYNSLRKLGIPTVILINKIDRMGVCLEGVINQIKDLLTEDIVPIQTVDSDMKIIDRICFESEVLIDKMTYYSDILLESVINEEVISKAILIESINATTRSCTMHPVVYGSALHGVGMVELLDVVVALLPSSTYIKEGELSGVVFKIIRDKSNKRQIYIRLYEGTIRSRQWLGDEKVSFVKVLRNGELEYTKEAYGNDIIVIEGVDSLKVGDLIGEPKSYHPISLGEPTLRTYITAEDKMKLVECLNNIAESDPFLQYELEAHSGDISLNLFGEIQMEILQALLYETYHLHVEFTPPFIIYKEMPKGVGEYTLKIYTKEHPFRATVGLRVEPDILFSIDSEVSTGFLPQRFQNGVIDGITSYLKEGLFGWELVNLKVTLIEGAFNSVDSTPSDFRNLTPMVFFEALSLAKTKLLWPVNDFEIRVNNHDYGKVMADLSVMQASDIVTLQERDYFRITGLLPLETSLNYEKKFISDTSGFGVFLSKFHGYLDAPSDIEKIRTCNIISPLDRGNYLLSHLGTVNR